MQRRRVFIQLIFLNVGVSPFRNGDPWWTRRPRFDWLGEIQGMLCALLPWLVTYFIILLLRSWRFTRRLFTHSSYIFLIQAKWQGVLRLASHGYCWLTTGFWIWVLISEKQALRLSLPNCQFVTCHRVSLALANSVLSVCWEDARLVVNLWIFTIF